MPAKNKDPNKPKGRVTAYAFFVQHCNQDPKNMSSSSESSDDDDGPAIAKRARKVSRKWKKLTDDEKIPFHDRAETDKKRYEKQMKEYVPSGAEGGETKGRRSKKKPKDPTKPKRHMSGFFFFSGKFRASVKELLEKDNPGSGTVGSVAKKLGERWSTIPDKETYNDMARKDKERYEHEMELWKKGEYSREDEEEQYSDAED